MVLLFCKTSIHHISDQYGISVLLQEPRQYYYIWQQNALVHNYNIYSNCISSEKLPPNARAEYYFFGNSKNTSKKSIVT